MSMSRLHHLLQLMCSLLIFAELTSGNSDDMAVLIQLKAFLQAHNQINQGAYAGWLEAPEASPCSSWQGVGCDMSGRVSSLDLSGSSISGPLFGNFSGLRSLVRLDLSDNSITGELPADLDRCVGLEHLNLSYNLISGALSVPSLTKLRTLDVSRNRLEGEVCQQQYKETLEAEDGAQREETEDTDAEPQQKPSDDGRRARVVRRCNTCVTGLQWAV